jgi:hypothetical protein
MLEGTCIVSMQVPSAFRARWGLGERGRTVMFDVDQFVADCVAARPEGMLAVKEVLDRALSAPGEIEAALVYGGDFITKPRSIWDPDERPADGETVRRLFEDARARQALD